MSTRSRLPMLLLTAAVVLGAGAYVFRDRLPAGLWPGLTEDARATAPAPPPAAAAIRVSVVSAQRRTVAFMSRRSSSTPRILARS